MSFDSSTRSASSGSKSKRSLNSVSSNPSSNGSKKKTSQKTLGMAWGSNSRSSSRSSFRSSPFTDFGSYMEVKNRKLHDQFDAEASSSSHSGAGPGKPIFNGVSIFVDGYTVPSSQELRGYMLKHGGRFENYFSRHHVTHIICSNLPDSKIKNLRSFSGGLPVVKPTWVLDSVAANKLLSWIPYQLDQVASETNNQPKLSAFFSMRSNVVGDDQATCLSNHIVSGTEDPSMIGGTVMDASFAEEGESMKETKQDNGEFDAIIQENSSGTVLEDQTYSNKKNYDAKIAEPSDVARGRVEMQPESSPCQPSVSVRSCCLDDQNTKESSSTIVDFSNQRHSTLVDPNFVENYFKNSRLHFIGTWRNRYRKRFPSLSGGSRPSSSSLNASSMSQKAAIIHVDMDCFFVSVVIRNHPELLDKPVAVCHSDNPRGTAEISSANYPARGHGVRAGIFVRDAKALCPHLVIFPYDFEAYEEVADQFYSILHKYCNRVQAMSCDEAFLDVADSEVQDPQLLASVIRKEIFNTTGCTASAGISSNMLMARVATRAAKPDGQCYIPPEKVDDYLKELPIKALPGIGRTLEEKLKKKEVKTCGQLRMISKESLRKDFGFKIGDMLWNNCRGIDNRLVGMIKESKSIGAEVNWGVRFNDLKDSQHFVINLCKEVALRLQGCGVRGRTFTLKVKKRKTDAKEPTKYMGCGDCDNLSHSMTVPMATDDVDVLQRITTQLFGLFRIDVKDIRGMGLQVSKLESADNDKQGHERNSIRSWLASSSAGTGEHCEVSSLAGKSVNIDNEEQIDGNLHKLGNNLIVASNMSNGEATIHQDSALPPLCDLDMGVIESLPPELFSEINDMYGGKLTSFMLKHKGKTVDIGSISTSLGNVEGLKIEETAPLPNLPTLGGVTIAEEERQELHLLPASRAGTSNVVTSASIPENYGLMPSSLSQVDVSVLQQLPEELRVDLLELLPAHRRLGCALDASPGPHDSFRLNSSEIQPRSEDHVSSNEVWNGSPPRWVEKFEASDCQILKVFAGKYRGLGHSCDLSSILLQIMSETCICLDGTTDGWNDAVSYFLEVFKQYIKRKIESDIEEIYMCFRLLRRLSAKSEFFVQVYDIILPHLQATVGEKYGGIFPI